MANFPGLNSIDVLDTFDDFMGHLAQNKDEIDEILSSDFSGAIEQLYRISCPGYLAAIAWSAKRRCPTTPMTHEQLSLFRVIITDRIDSFMLLHPQSPEDFTSGPDDTIETLESLFNSDQSAN